MKQIRRSVYWCIALIWLALVSYVAWKSIENFLTLKNGVFASYFCVVVTFCAGVAGIAQALTIASRVTAWIIGEQVASSSVEPFKE